MTTEASKQVDATREVVDDSPLPPTSDEKVLAEQAKAIESLSEDDLLSPDERRLLQKYDAPTGMADPRPEVAREWWKIFGDLTDGKTVSEVAEEYGVSCRHVRRVREWGHAQLSEVDRTSIDDLRHRLLLNRRKYRDLLDNASHIDEAGVKHVHTKETLAIMREARANDIVLAKVEGWLIPAIMAPDANIQVIMPTFKMRPKQDEMQQAEITDIKCRTEVTE
jgi:transposase-like protein